MTHAAAVQAVLAELLRSYSLPINGVHGVVHWARVLENGVRLAESTGANIEVVRLFAVLHDSKRINEDHDPEHGLRTAEASELLRGKLFQLGDEGFALLYVACADHTHELTHSDVTVQTCWDADRLDLGRVGIEPRSDRLCTPSARSAVVREWANRRSYSDSIPDFVRNEWNINLGLIADQSR